jgi:hypothetical protein
MNRPFKYLLVITLFITFSNIPPLNTIFRLFDELIPAFDKYATGVGQVAGIIDLVSNLALYHG